METIIIFILVAIIVGGYYLVDIAFEAKEKEIKEAEKETEKVKKQINEKVNRLNEEIATLKNTEAEKIKDISNYKGEIIKKDRIIKQKEGDILELKQNNETLKNNHKQEKDKILNDSNALVDAKDRQLKETSKKLANIIDGIRQRNNKRKNGEDIDELLKQFDAFYIIDAAIVQQININERQAQIHRQTVKNKNKIEKTLKRYYDRLRAVCTKHKEPMFIKEIPVVKKHFAKKTK